MGVTGATITRTHDLIYRSVAPKGSVGERVPHTARRGSRMVHGLSLDVLEAKREGTADATNDIRSMPQLLVNREMPA